MHKLIIAVFCLILLTQCRTTTPSQLKGPYLASVPYGLTERCENGKAKYWAQKIMDVDLMHLYLQRKAISSVAMVSILDSGFDNTQRNAFDVVDRVQTERGVLVGDTHPYMKPTYEVKNYGGDEYIGDPEKDENGHGTMVASVIGGSGLVGVAKNVHLKVYRVTKSGANGSTASAVLQMSMAKACKEHNDPDGIAIVNVSWGGRFDEGGLQPDETKSEFQPLLNQFAEQGCLIVKSAGNSNFRAHRSFDLNDPYLRVAAVDTSMELASFSSRGEIKAPGADIYVYDTSARTRYRGKDRKCSEEKNRTFVNGTSFAAPFVAGIASQVVRVLKSQGGFHGLTNPQRIKLINRILKKSELAGSVNGLRAVHFAFLFSGLTLERKLQTLQSPELKYLDTLKSDEVLNVCLRPNRACHPLNDENSIRSCVSTTRARVALCQNITQAELVDLTRTNFREDAIEQGIHYLRAVQNFAPSPDVLFTLRQQATMEYLKKLGFSNEKNRWGRIDRAAQGQVYAKMNPNFVREVIAPYLAEWVKTRPINPEIIATLTKSILTSLQVQRALEMGLDPVTGEDRGSGSVLKGVESIMQTALQALGNEGFSNLLAEIVQEEIQRIDRDIDFKRRYQSYLPVDGSSAVFRILDSVTKLASNGSLVHTRTFELERLMLETIRRTNQYYAYQTADLPLYTEHYPTRATLKPVLKRHEAGITKVFRSDPRALSSVEAFYIISRPKAFGLEPVTFAMSLFKVIAQGEGWGERNDSELVERLLVLTSEALSDDRRALDAARTTFNQIIIDAKNASFIQQLMNGYSGNKTFFSDISDFLIDDNRLSDRQKNGLTYRSSPLLSPVVMQIIASKLVGMLKTVDASSSESGSSSATRFAYSDAVLFINASSETLANLAVSIPNYSQPSPDRVNVLTSQALTKPLSTLGFNELVTELIRLVRAQKTRRWTAEIFSQVFEIIGDYSLLSSYENDRKKRAKAMLARLDTNEPWYKALKEFVSESKDHKYYVSHYRIENFYRNLQLLQRSPAR